MTEFRNYHIILMDGTERNIRAKSVEVKSNGTLVFSNSELVVAYSAGNWKMVETEQKDDKG